jgi:hypothetical protein
MYSLPISMTVSNKSAYRLVNKYPDILHRCMIIIGCILRHPRALIARYGGVDTLAVITGFTDNRHGRALCYRYTDAPVEGGFAASTLAKITDPQEKAEALRRIVHGTWSQSYTGQVQTDWDVQESLLHDRVIPRWCLRYQEGYTFPIRYLKHDPAVHYILESFDFRR